MPWDVTLALLTGGFGLGGGLGGVLLSGAMGQKSDRRRLAAEDARRWLSERRRSYARFLDLAEAMLRQVDRIGVFLSCDGSEPMSDEDRGTVEELTFEYIDRWEEELQPALHDVQLMAGEVVSDLADRVSGGLLLATVPLEHAETSTFQDYYPTWFQTRDLVHLLRSAMREELGLPPLSAPAFPRDDPDWPWLPDRPACETYVQHHAKPSI